MGAHKSYIVEVAPERPASDGKPASGPEYRAVIAKDGPPQLEGIETLYEMFSASVQRYPNNKCLGKRNAAGEYEWITYKEAEETAAAISSAMIKVGLKPHDRAGVYGANSPEWMLAMQACNRMTIYCVPLYDSLGESAVEYIIKHSESSLIFTQSEKFPMLVKALPNVASQIKAVVYWGKPDDATITAAQALGVTVYSYEEFLQMGRESPLPAIPPTKNDLCTIMYTSGTTGDPKGVKVTHNGVLITIVSMKNFVASVGAAFTENEVFLSFLPLAHIFDRSAEELMLHLGASIGYWRGDIKGLVDDIGALKPTLFCGVPRVFDRIYSGVQSKIAEGSFFKRFMYNYGFNRKLQALQSGHSHEAAAPFFDKLVFSKIKERLGGKVRLIVSGGAPLSRHVEDFLRVTMCCPVVQGYGLTETCAASFIAVPDVYDQAGTVGPPQPVLSFRLEAVPEMNYDPIGSPARGELCVKGPSVFTGYYKAEDKTAEVLEADGWFHTGDIAEIMPDGALRIIDRKKNIFKLSQGEYIAVEKVEGVYNKDDVVEQIWVYGNSFESSLVAVVVPTENKIKELAHHAPKDASFADLCKDSKVKQAILESLNATGKGGKLKGFEMVRAVYLEHELFSVENDLLTPTFKLKRPQLQKKYQGEIDAMYAGMKKK